MAKEIGLINSNVEQIYSLADECLKKGQNYNSNVLLELAHSLKPDSLEIAYKLKDTYDKLNHYAEGIGVLKEMLYFYPNDENLLNDILEYYKKEPDLNVKIKKINQFVENVKKTKRNENKKRILWTMSFSIYKPCKVHDYLLSKALEMRGAEIIPVICGKAQIGECNVFGGLWGNYTGDKERDKKVSEKNCETCINSDKSLWENWCHLNPLGLKDFSNDFDHKAIWEFLCSLDNNYSDWKYDEMPVGRWAMDILRNNEMLYNETRVNGFKDKLKNYVYNIIIVIEGMKNILESVEPDIIVSNDSFYYEWAVVEYLAKKRGIPFYNQWSGGRKMGWAYNMDKPAMELNFDDTWDYYKNISLQSHQSNTVKKFLANRFKGNDMVFNTAKPNLQETVYDDENILLLDSSKPTALLVANIIWDLAALNREVIFNDMIEWIIETIRFFQENPQFQLIIKPHPGEENSNIPETKEKVKNEIQKIIEELPQNVILLEPKTKYSVYDLIPKADLALVYTTTVGLEISCSGIPVITAGKSHYYGKGFTYDPKSKQEYKEQIENLLLTKKENDAEKIALAKKFLYLYFYKYYTQLNLFDYSYTSDPLLVISSGIELLPGANSVLDYICDAIINSKPIISKSKLVPDSILRRGLYSFSQKETIAGAHVIINQYEKKFKLKEIQKLNGFIQNRINTFDFVVPENTFKTGELEWIYNEVFLPSDINPHAYVNDFIKIEKNDFVIDLGACEGFFTKFALLEGASKVFSFEPYPSLNQALSYTFDKEIKSGNIQLSSYGLSNKNSISKISNGKEFISEAAIGNEGNIDVQITTLDDLVKEKYFEKIDFIKIDIEGEEVNAILGSISAINKFRPKISIAVYHDYVNAYLIKNIIENNCDNYAVQFGGRYMWEIPNRPVMLYAVPSEKFNGEE